jgi:hypothetical protein
VFWNASLRAGNAICALAGFTLLLGALARIVLWLLGGRHLPSKRTYATLLRENPLKLSFVLLALLAVPGLLGLGVGAMLILVGLVGGGST